LVQGGGAGKIKKQDICLFTNYKKFTK